MTLGVEIVARVRASQVGANDFGGPRFDPTIEALLQLQDGTGANQADKIWADERTLGSAGATSIDLKGSLTDAFGEAFTPSELVAVMLVNKPRAQGATPNTTALTVGGASDAVAAFADALPAISPGGVVLLASPGAAGLGAVTTAADKLRVANASGASNTFQLLVVARSA